VGWQPHRGPLLAAEAFLLLIVLRYALTWVGVYVGLTVKNEETANQLVQLFFPLTMLSNSFVPTDGMPAWLRVIAEWNPVSALTAACRTLFGNPGTTRPDAPWPLVHPVAAVLLWSADLLVVFVPLSIRTYARRGR
ncbi:MAG: ABC transporter permease, partial [Streptomycetaceae bacterium]|nr:ABC transporter permease [Streptomycetaceae bacterium]